MTPHDPAKRTVFILSDSTGDTASRVVRAALKQFMSEGLAIRRFPNVLRQSEVRSIVEEASRGPTLVAHTFASSALRQVVEDVAAEHGIRSLDLLGPLLTTLQDFLRSDPKGKPGLFHEINAEYFRKIDAVEFAVMHDDGKHLEGLEHADIVLIGLSRTGKTPLSVYLALEGWRVANVPLVGDRPLPEQVLAVPRERLVGLIIDPRRLAEIRRSRLSYIAPGTRMAYDDESSVRDEIAWCRRQFGRERVKMIDVTQKAIEESAHEVLSYVKRATGGQISSDPSRGRKLA